MVQSITDADNNPVTTYGYDNTGTFVTSVTRPTTNGIQHVSQASFDFSSGLVTQTIDENQQPTGYSYYSSASDPNLGKEYQVTYPDGGVKTYSYPSAREVDTAAAENANSTISASKIVDPFGRPYQSTQAGISTETSYDSNGRVYCVTNLHVGSSSSTDGSTCYSYDGPLDRVWRQTQPDSSTVYSIYYGNTVTVKDETRRSKEYQYDAFHQLTAVWEPDTTGALTLETDYQHDALGNVICVQQQGGVSGTGCSAPYTSDPSSPWHVRRFLYDSLSRLLQSYSPETGYVCYGTTGGAPANWTNCTPGYDPNGNLLHKTDGRGVTTNYAYDYLNRLMSKIYSNPPVGSLLSCYT
jgi:YD repeat-containing protein